MKILIIDYGKKCYKTEIKSEEMYAYLEKNNDATIISVSNFGEIDQNEYQEFTNYIQDSELIIYTSCAAIAERTMISAEVIEFCLKKKTENTPLYLVGCTAKVKTFQDNFGSRNDVKCFPEYEDFIHFLGAKDFKPSIYNIDDDAAYLAINHGCLRKCTFCRSNYMNNNNLNSVSLENIISETSNIKEECITIIGTNTTEYGIDIYGKQMLHEVIKIASKNENVKSIVIGSVQMAEMYPELLSEICTNEKIKTISFSLESGSDRISKLMNRGYTVADLDKIFTEIRKYRGDNIEFATVIISGFPTETKEDMKQTINFIKKYNLHVESVISYYQGFGLLPADKYEQLTEKEINMHTKVYKKVPIIKDYLLK
jgi:ribosomal protein S12 methylthiotransferase